MTWKRERSPVRTTIWRSLRMPTRSPTAAPISC
jgi:hypothetical protein